MNPNLNRFGALLTSKLEVTESNFDYLALLTIANSKMDDDNNVIITEPHSPHWEW